MTRFSFGFIHGGYTIPYSGDFDGDSGFLSRTSGSAGDSRRIITISTWFKRASISAAHTIVAQGANASNETFVAFNVDNTLRIQHNDAGAATFAVTTTPTYTDTSGWHHLLVLIDTTTTPEASRVLVYVDGSSQATSITSGSIPVNKDTDFSTTDTLRVGARSDASQLFDGNLADFRILDGVTGISTASFLDVDGAPIAYSGSYGSAGIYLDFAASADQGNDVSGNGNDLTETADVTQSTDTPTS